MNCSELSTNFTFLDYTLQYAKEDQFGMYKKVKLQNAFVDDDKSRSNSSYSKRIKSL